MSFVLSIYYYVVFIHGLEPSSANKRAINQDAERWTYFLLNRTFCELGFKGQMRTILLKRSYQRIYYLLLENKTRNLISLAYSQNRFTLSSKFIVCAVLRDG